MTRWPGRRSRDGKRRAAGRRFQGATRAESPRGHRKVETWLHQFRLRGSLPPGITIRLRGSARLLVLSRAISSRARSALASAIRSPNVLVSAADRLYSLPPAPNRRNPTNAVKVAADESAFTGRL